MGILMLAIVVMAGTGLVLGVVIGLFAKLFQIKTDPRIDLVIELLPGANCGGCGMAGCSDFAKAVVSGKAAPSQCPVSSSEQVGAIAKALGIEAGEAFKQKAVVLCGGDQEQTLRRAEYNGVADCVSASLVAGGPKGCAYGCLGMGSCARRCPFGAIEMINGLAVVHGKLCVGCGSCVAVCPRKVIKLVPADAEVHIYCNSPLKAPAKRQVCKVACIGCRKCVKTAPEKFLLEGFKAAVLYAHPPFPTQEDVQSVGCPTGALLTAEEHLHIEKHDPEWSAEK